MRRILTLLLLLSLIGLTHAACYSPDANSTHILTTDTTLCGKTYSVNQLWNLRIDPATSGTFTLDFNNAQFIKSTNWDIRVVVEIAAVSGANESQIFVDATGSTFTNFSSPFTYWTSLTGQHGLHFKGGTFIGPTGGHCGVLAMLGEPDDGRFILIEDMNVLKRATGVSACPLIRLGGPWNAVSIADTNIVIRNNIFNAMGCGDGGAPENGHWFVRVCSSGNAPTHIYGNTLYDSFISLESSSIVGEREEIYIEDNEFTYSKGGPWGNNPIVIYGSNNIRKISIIGNTLLDTRGGNASDTDAIDLNSAIITDFNVIGNNIAGFRVGIENRGGSGGIFADNNITDIGTYGLRVGASDVEIRQNTISEWGQSNAFGAGFGYGLMIDGGVFNETIIRNALLGSTGGFVDGNVESFIVYNENASGYYGTCQDLDADNRCDYVYNEGLFTDTNPYSQLHCIYNPAACPFNIAPSASVSSPNGGEDYKLKYGGTRSIEISVVLSDVDDYSEDLNITAWVSTNPLSYETLIIPEEDVLTNWSCSGGDFDSPNTCTRTFYTSQLGTYYLDINVSDGVNSTQDSSNASWTVSQAGFFPTTADSPDDLVAIIFDLLGNFFAAVATHAGMLGKIILLTVIVSVAITLLDTIIGKGGLLNSIKQFIKR